MARTFTEDGSTESVTDATQVETEGTEAVQPATPVESTVTEVTATEGNTSTEGSTEAVEPTQPAQPVDEVDYEALFETFKESAKSAISGNEEDGRDQDTGSLSLALIEKVRATYAPLNTKHRNGARTWLESQMSDAMIGQNDYQDGADYGAARSMIELLNALKASTPKPQITKAPVDPTQGHVARIVALLLAPNLVPVPEGTATNWQQLAHQKQQELASQVIEYRDWQNANAGKPADEQTEAPKVDEIVLLAANIAKGRAPKVSKPREPKVAGQPRAPRQPSVSSGVRRDIAAHIRSAFADKNSGDFMSIGEICRHKSEEYGDDSPSQGAVAARLYPNKQPVTLEAAGVKAEVRDSKGAVKL
jgi:hypothetical protein